ncbi:MAG: tripartite tricarboxylate transporter substrate binding protein [Polaromonas sp.]|uniref:Bug family tripartite tricarboxylate transporter substrate binding protein n=1 Tax=Polaromonas sp. TaxID=1869339 RepID=UPI0025FAA1E6|nr:tripartite tricarboxylate transporter substrate binding protein [Polaromonas sp.]MBI2726121.1 tripartite tricarboxylate transporter substrate binding protein [Polaromonas sp.]
MTYSLNRRTALAALAAAGAPSVFAQAPAFPNKPLRVIVPQPPGGGFDVVGRLLADRLGKALKQPVVVENRTGSGTLNGTDLAAKADADGYTLVVGSISNIALNMGLYKNPPYNSLRDFEPLGLAVSYSYTLMCRKDLPYKTLKDVIAYARANPGKLTYASAGVGSGQHVLAAALWQQAGVDITHVPYRGAQMAYQDLIGGRVDMFFDLSPTARPQIESGNVRALAVSGATRQPTLPDVPTIRDSGVAKLELESWFGLFAPAKTPPKVLERLRKEMDTIIASRDVSDTFRKAGGRSLSLSLPETRALVKRDTEFWSKLIRELDIKAE